VQVKPKRLSLFERYLTAWVALCMVIGVLMGKALPGIVAAVRSMEFGESSHINVSIAVLIYAVILFIVIPLAAGGCPSSGWPCLKRNFYQHC